MIKLRGFTLIELLTVLAIATILATIGMNAYTQNLKRARDNKRRSEIEQIRSALEIYRADFLSTGYPDSTSTSNFINDYMNGTVPRDALRGFAYHYDKISDTQYELCAHLEAPVSPCTTAGTCCGSANCGGGVDPNWTCNYRAIQP